jgi:hypothetical protein
MLAAKQEGFEKALLCFLDAYLSGSSSRERYHGAMKKEHHEHMEELILKNADLARRLDTIERRYNKHFKVVFVALTKLLPSEKRAGAARRPMGFITDE